MLDIKSLDLKKEIKKLEELSGKERAEDIKFLISYVKDKNGKDGLAKVFNELDRCGYKIPDLLKLDDMDWIPISLPNIFLVASVKTLEWDEKDLVELGRKSFSYKKMYKFFIKFFMSLEKTIDLGASSWKKHYSVGKIEIASYDKKNKEMTIRIIGYKSHPFTCLYHRGVFEKLIEICTGSDKVKVEETKCVFKGDPYHEYKFNW